MPNLPIDDLPQPSAALVELGRPTELLARLGQAVEAFQAEATQPPLAAHHGRSGTTTGSR